MESTVWKYCEDLPNLFTMPRRPRVYTAARQTSQGFFSDTCTVIELPFMQTYTKQHAKPSKL